MKISFPIIVLGFGDPQNTRRLLAVGDSPVVLPVFTDPELAERYRATQEEQLREGSLPISMLGDDEGDELDICTLAIPDADAARDVVEVVMMIGRVGMIAIDPPHDGSSCLCMEIDEFLQTIGFE